MLAEGEILGETLADGDMLADGDKPVEIAALK